MTPELGGGSRTTNDYLGYAWVCPICYHALRVTQGTPMASISLSLFDFALNMWIKNATPHLSGHMSQNFSQLQSLFLLFRKCYTHYWKTYVGPYLVLPGIVEIDETKISRQRWHFKGGFPKKIRWVFGMYCRSTGIPIVYEIQCKNHDYLVNILKKHV